MLGSINELDDWKQQGNFTHVMRCKDGYIWESVAPMVTHSSHFYYKYALVENNNQVVGWEKGVDRVADLDIMPEACFVQNSYKPPEYFYDIEEEVS